MNYRKIYDQIIEKRKLEEPQDCYTEVHHIVPRSLGGNDNKDNLVKLTAREHFICHYLLAKMYDKETIDWYKMNHAFMMMKCDNIIRDRYYNSRLYEALRGNFSSIMSFAQSGSKNSNYGKMWITNGIESKPIIKGDNIPDGWYKGRTMNRVIKLCKVCSTEIPHGSRSEFCGGVCKDIFRSNKFKEKNEPRTRKLYIDFIKSNLSLFDFAKQTPITDVALSRLFRKYIPEYIGKKGPRTNG